MTFVPGRDQDASSTIRGFVYQAEVTILRWLSLPSDEVLQLECGEDIDSVLRAGNAPSSERARLLEQVKDVKRAMTLRAPGPVAALVAFHAHRTANLGRNLRFRFTTTAPVGRERPSTLPKGTNGIFLWEKVRSLPPEEAPKPADLTGLRDTLRSAAQPEEVQEDAWKAFRHFIDSSTDTELVAYVRSFEWSTGNEDSAHIQAQIISTLQTRTGLTSVDAAILHDKLFAFVFRTLSKAGVKELSGALLVEELQKPVLSTSDHALLVDLQDGVLRQALKLASLETRIEQVESTTTALLQHLNLRPQSLELIEASILPVADKPPLVAQLTQRETLLTDLLRDHPTATWIAIDGIAGSGKSHLAGILANRRGGRLRWMNFRGMGADTLATRISQALTRQQAAGADDERLDAIVAGDVVVLDDLPSLDTSPKLQAFLAKLVELCTSCGAFVISTSGLALPQTLRDGLGTKVAAVAAPPFTTDEVRDLCTQAGAPDSLSDKAIDLLHGACGGGYPVLVRAGIAYMRAHSWKIDRERLQSIFLGAHTEALATETLRRVMESVTQDACRDLLYRICFSDNPLSLSDIQTLAAISPASNRHLECLQALEGVWVQPAGSGQYEASPLIRRFGSSQLAPNVRKQVSRVMADRVLRSQVLDFFDVMRACMYFVGAEDHNQAVTLAMWASGETRRAGAHQDAADIVTLIYPPDKELPATLDRAHAAMLRGFQARAVADQGDDPMPYIRSLRSIATQLKADERWGLVSAWVQLIAVPSGKLPFDVVLEVTEHIENSAGQVRMRGNEHAVPMWKEGAAWLFASMRVTSWPELWTVLKAFDRLSSQRKQSLLAQERIRTALLMQIDRLMLASAEGNTGALPRAAALQELQQLAEWSRERGYGWLFAAAIRGVIVIRIEYQKERDQLPVLANEALSQLSGSDPGRVLIQKTWGEQLEFVGDHAGAIPHLREALGTPGIFSTDTTILTTLTASEAAFNVDLPQALIWLEGLAGIVPDIRDSGLRVQVYAELAIVRWNSGLRSEAYDALDKAADLLVSLDLTDRLKGLFVRLGHVIAYYAHLATCGHAPPSKALPTPAFMRGSDPEVSRQYRPNSGTSMLGSILATLASAVGKSDRAIAWGERAFQDAIDFGIPLAISTAATFVVESAIRSGDLGHTFDAAITGAVAMGACDSDRKAGRDPSRDDFRVSIDQLLEDKEARQAGERSASYMLLTPLAIRVVEVATDSSAMETVATTIARAVSTYAPTSSAPEEWERVANMFRLLAVPDGGAALCEMSRDQSLDGTLRLRPLAYLLASIHPKVDWTTSLKLQCGCLLFLLRFASLDSGSGPFRLARVVTKLWKERFNRLRASFSSPGAMEAEFNAATAHPPVEEMKKVLAVIAGGLRCALPNETLKWLNGPSA